MTALKDTSTP